MAGEIFRWFRTLSDIITVDGTRIKQGNFEGILEDRKLKYRWPRPQPWRQAYRRVMEKLANYICIRTSILIKKLGAFVDTERSQEFLFQWESISDRLIDFRASETVEHININERPWETSTFQVGKRTGERQPQQPQLCGCYNYRYTPFDAWQGKCDRPSTATPKEAEKRTGSK